MKHNTPLKANLTLEDDMIRCVGPWTARALADVERRLQRLRVHRTVSLDLSGITALDTAGAWLLRRTVDRLERRGAAVFVEGATAHASELLGMLGPYRSAQVHPPAMPRPWPLENLGRRSVERVREAVRFTSLIGETAVAVAVRLPRPGRLRWKAVFHHVQTAGFDALPIVGLLSFLLGVVIAYQGGLQLRQYGANVFVADLVALSMVRELAPLMTAIIIAGRTGAAFTAQIGTMKVTEELDALRTMGVDPLERLVLPRLIGLVIALPLLTVFAGAAGLLGGAITANLLLDVGSATFIQHMGRTVTLASYLIGIGKAPVFAAIIAWVGCFQGLQVKDSAESVGRQTTISVVQSIFLVIIADAVFSVIFSEVGL